MNQEEIEGVVLNHPAIETYTFSLGPYDRKNKLL
jgi:hypothetical protein